MKPTANNEIWRSRFFGMSEFVHTFTWLDDRMDFYSDVARGLHIASGADNVNIRLLTPANDVFKLYAKHGDASDALLEEFSAVSTSTGRMPLLIESGEPIVFDFSSPTSEDVKWERGSEDGFSCAAIIALPGAEGILGAADLLFHDRQSWGEEDIAWLKELGRLAGTVISNAILSDEAFNLRLAEERNRLSTEIHDNLAQSASVILLEANDAADSLAAKDMDALGRDLDLIKRASVELEHLIRGELSSLRTGTQLDGVSALKELDQMVQAFSKQWGIPCTLERADQASLTEVSNRVLMQLVRVVSEALVNVIRHASAKSVRVSYSVDNGVLDLSIEDDGVGFDANNVPQSHLGIRIMRERLASIGAKMRIDSSPGSGTVVFVSVPYFI